MKAQGWYRDPYDVHEDRYFSDGQPTKLVRDGSVECYDPPPPGPPKGQLVEVGASERYDGKDMRRADDLTTGPKAAFVTAMACVAVYGPSD